MLTAHRELLATQPQQCAQRDCLIFLKLRKPLRSLCDLLHIPSLSGNQSPWLELHNPCQLAHCAKHRWRHCSAATGPGARTIAIQIARMYCTGL